jgi:hypothetical protein
MDGKKGRRGLAEKQLQGLIETSMSTAQQIEKISTRSISTVGALKAGFSDRFLVRLAS